MEKLRNGKKNTAVLGATNFVWIRPLGIYEPIKRINKA
jgi:hypothetical protein